VSTKFQVVYTPPAGGGVNKSLENRRTALAELELARHVDAGVVDEQLWTAGGGHRAVVVSPDLALQSLPRLRRVRRLLVEYGTCPQSHPHTVQPTCIVVTLQPIAKE